MIQKRIDTHVHCRDWDEKYKTTISEVTKLARKNGIYAIVNMPNN